MSQTNDSGSLSTMVFKRTITGATVNAVMTDEFTVSCPGAQVGDGVVVSPDTKLPDGLGLGGARVSAANVVSIAIANGSAGNIASGNVAFTIQVFRQLVVR